MKHSRSSITKRRGRGQLQIRLFLLALIGIPGILAETTTSSTGSSSSVLDEWLQDDIHSYGTLPSATSSTAKTHGSSWLDDWWNQVSYRGGTLTKIVDMHLHTGLWKDLPTSFQDDLLTQIPFPFNCRALAEPFVNLLLSATGILSQLKCARISTGVLLAVYAPDTTGVAQNKFVRRQIADYPDKFYGLASLPVIDWPHKEEQSLQLLEKYLDMPNKFIGIKMAHPHMKINLNDPAYYSIYHVAADYKVPVYIHTGKAGSFGSSTNKEATHPDFIEEAIQLYSNVTFILGHMGNKADFDGLDDPYDACFRLALTYNNVYLEASALGSESNDPDGDKLYYIYQTAKDNNLIHRMIYGSDGPQFPGFVNTYLQRTLTALERADYSVHEAQQVLSDNFQTLFGIEL